MNQEIPLEIKDVYHPQQDYIGWSDDEDYEEIKENNSTQRRTKRGKKYEKFKSGVYLALALKTPCCKKMCLTTVLTPEDIQGCLTEFWERSEECQREFILNYLHFSSTPDKNGLNRYEYRIKGKNVCQQAWQTSYGISNGRFHNLKSHFEAGRSSPMSIRGGNRTSKRMLTAQLWFEKYVEKMADRMPDEKKFHLPSCVTKIQVFKTYQESFKGRKTLSYSQFRRMWAHHYAYVIIPKTSRFTKCGICTLIKDNALKLKNKKRRLTWLEIKKVHLIQQTRERKKYYKHQEKARKSPKKYLSIIMDGMDQAKTNIPHFRISSKDDGEFAKFLKVHVTGVISHGNNTSICLLDFARWPQDSNVTANALLTTLRIIKEKTGSLAPVLYWQMDNCFRDCKNIYILGFCAYLIKAKVFKKVKLSYLMVGHTHEDVDQMFSRISVSLRKLNVGTLDTLRNVISESYTPRPLTTYVDNIYDIKSWLLPVIYPLRYHSTPHTFRCKENARGEVEMTYKLWAGEEQKPWQPANAPVVVMEMLPPGTPAVARPENKSNNCPEPEVMEKAIRHLSPRMKESELKWWEKFVVAEKKKRDVWQVMTDLEYEEASRSFTVASLQYAVTDPTKEESDDDQDVIKAEGNLIKLVAKASTMRPIERLPPGRNGMGMLYKRALQKSQEPAKVKRRKLVNKKPKKV